MGGKVQFGGAEERESANVNGPTSSPNAFTAQENPEIPRGVHHSKDLHSCEDDKTRGFSRSRLSVQDV